LADVVNKTIHNKGNLFNPSFAVGRAQELTHLVDQLKKEKRIPNIPVIMDSPMGADATNVLHKYPARHKLMVKECNAVCKEIFIIRDYRDTLKIIKQKGSNVVITASGILTGGKVLQYMKIYINDKKNIILLVGFQAEGTR